MDKVLFVRTANICRSPTVEAIFNALMENEGLSFHARSAGTSALTGRGLAPNASAALEEIGVYANDHRARRVSGTLLENADLVLTMSLEELGQLYGNLPSKAYTLPEYTGSDVIGGRQRPRHRTSRRIAVVRSRASAPGCAIMSEVGSLTLLV